jgi:hypothetical protein
LAEQGVSVSINEPDEPQPASATMTHGDDATDDDELLAVKRWFAMEQASQRHWLPKRSLWIASSTEETESVVLFADVAEVLFTIDR